MSRFNKIALAVLIITCSAYAQPQQPSAEHKALSMIIGQWTIRGMEDSFIEICEWYQGGFYVVCNSESKSKTGLKKGVSILGYSADNKHYTYYHYGSSGNSQTLVATYKDGSFHFTGEEIIKGQLTKTRVTLTLVGKDLNFREETSVANGPWVADSLVYVRLK